MSAERPAVVVFSEKELHPFYKVFAARMGSAKVVGCGEASAWVQRGEADLAIIDCGFRISRGLKLLREIKRAGSETMVVIVTETSSEEAVIEAYESGVRSYLKKPISVSYLRRVAKNLLRLKGQAKEKRFAYIPDAKPPKIWAGEVRTGKPANLLRAVQFIEENLGEPLDLEACAKAGSLSKFQFCRAFRRHLGMSPMRFVTFLRIDRAKTLLGRDDLNMFQIALSVGFKNYGTFIKAFKNHTGVLPNTFRKAVRVRVPG